MKKRQYKIAMRTDVGIRYGTMTVSTNGNRIEGTLYVLKKANLFSGKIRQNGECRIKGEITTLMRSVPYVASGWVTEEGLCFLLKGQQETFELSGRAVVPPAEREKEQD